MKSSVVLIGEKALSSEQLSLQVLSRLSDLDMRKTDHIDVIILPILIALSDDAKKYLHILQAQNPALQLILIAPKGSYVSDIQDCTNRFPVFLVIESTLPTELDPAVMMALEKSQQIQQNLQLEKLVQEQNERLHSLYRELEDRVKKRQTFLEESQEKAIVAHERWSLLLRITDSIQQAESIGEIEHAITTTLLADFNLLAARIYPRPQDQFFREQQKNKKNHSILEAPLRPRDDSTAIGSIFFLRTKDKPFKRDESEFLNKIAEVISLAIDRLYQFEQNLALKEHWQATFNAVSDPVIILNSSYEVLQANQAFEKLSKRRNASAQTKCYEVLFSRTSPCINCKLGKNFRTEELQFEVYSQPLTEPTSQEALYVNQYHDVTQQVMMERKILETTRMAEMGTIGSSIAHELNNPLGGMLSFAQLIKMDMPKDHPLYPDIEELESGIKRCRDIVQDLLSFSRNPVKDEKSQVDIRDAIDRAVKILELQSKSMGVEVRFSRPAAALHVEGYAGYLSQAIQNVLQHSLQNILEKAKSVKTFKGIIEIQVAVAGPAVQISIMDNGLALENWAALGLSVTRQILHDHGGILDFFEDSKPFHMAKITLPAKEV